MEVIHIHHPYKITEIPEGGVVLVLGFFDGVHRGHQKVIETARQEANNRGLKLAVMTFNHHPSVVFQKIDHKKMKYITTVEQKITRMEEEGVDILYVVEFTSAFAGLTPQEFVDQYIVGLNAVTAVAGFDYTYGK
ncbi:MAG: FAD synthetase family protein, partial [Vagococcus sp.]